MHDFFNVLIVIMLVAAFIWQRNVRHRRADDDRSFLSGGSDTREAELEHEVAELRRRIAVLERIATDDRHGRQIAAEIEALRD